MRNIKVEIISKETIKPSSPTPNHLRHYQLSFLDQISPKVYNPWLLFYSSDDIIAHNYKNITDISTHLKSSLSQTLSLYYPLAGRIKDDIFVDCNDAGAPFFEAKVKGTKLSEAMANPVINELNNLLPFKLDEASELTLGVQLSVFECGGISVGICSSHQISDALSTVTFVRAWSAIARGEISDVAWPEFVSAELFPPRANLGGANPNIDITRTKNVTKRFVFEASAIETLRAKLDGLSRPSRVEALSGFIWTRLVAATAVPKKLYLVIHAVNLRPKFDPPLQDRHFGNFYRSSMTVPASINAGREECFRGIIRQVREEIKKIDKGFVKKLQEGSDEHFNFLKERTERVVKNEFATVAFTSLCRFPVYEADFGWGNPTWLRSAALSFRNVVVFMDTKSGGGIEAYLSLKDEDMANLEVDSEFLSFVSLV